MFSLISYFCFVKQHVRTYLLGLIALFFISTTGVTVYKHYCSHGDASYHVFLDVNHNCEPKEVVEEHHSCCGNEESKDDFQLSEECCTSAVDFYQIDTDLINNDVDIAVENFYVSTISIPNTLVLPKLKKITTANKAPPSLSTNERLSLFQMYLI